ncbi:MAG TPA: HAMP domain-containing sensor histidine kinase [Gaiellaceae bacterium]|jgi:signal transduction histidine kinase|nr:HAMP domain-containing sensor histidine kinase [Gaiellaceae bacterium]
MATSSGTSLGGVAAVAPGRHGHAQLIALGGAGVLCALYVALPDSQILLREVFVYVGVEALTAAAIVMAVRWYQPAGPMAWLALAAGIGLWTVGDLIWGLYVQAGKNPFPSAADIFYLPGYVCIAAGFVIAARRRFAEKDMGAYLDTIILVASVGLLLWVYMIAPLRATSDLSTLATAITISYPLADLLLLGVAARFLVVEGAWRLRVFRWLVLALVLILAGDMATTLSEVGHTIISDHHANALVLAGVALFGIAALDSSMGSLTERIYVPNITPGIVRLGLIATATLLPSAVRITQALRGKPLFLPVTIGATVFIFVTALARWSGVLAQLQRMVTRENAVRRFSSNVLDASTQDELKQLAATTAKELVPSGTACFVDGGEQRLADLPNEVDISVTVRDESVGVLTAVSTTTEINRAGEALQSVADGLALALDRQLLKETERENAETLARQNEQLLELDQMKDRFVSMVSHELRTPLTSMIGYLEVTLDGEVGELNEEQQEFLEIVNNNCHRLDRLIDDILFMSRVDSGRLSLEPAWISIDEVAAACVRTARVAAEQKQLTLEYTAEPNMPKYWGDAVRLSQMFDNLLSNARKYTDEGGAVRVSIVLRDETIHIEVADSGVGIPEDEVDRLFERFFRASTGLNAQGTGLGLSILQSIVQVHGGSVSVRSELGVGTTFEVDLPLPGIPGAPSPDTTEVAA